MQILAKTQFVILYHYFQYSCLNKNNNKTIRLTFRPFMYNTCFLCPQFLVSDPNQKKNMSIISFPPFYKQSAFGFPIAYVLIFHKKVLNYINFSEVSTLKHVLLTPMLMTVLCLLGAIPSTMIFLPEKTLQKIKNMA